MNKLKIITTTSESDQLYIINTDSGPFLAYNDTILDLGGSPTSRLIKCSDLEQLLSSYLIKDTKFIVSIYNPLLYYLVPCNDNNSLFSVDNEFIPTIPIQNLIKGEVNGFDSSEPGKQVRSLKFCDNWNNDLQELEEIEERIDEEVYKAFGAYNNYRDMDFSKEVPDMTGGFSDDLSTDPRVINLLSNSSYTDTINIEDWAYQSCVKGGMSGKLDVSFMYSVRGEMSGGMQTISAFRYEENLVSGKSIFENAYIRLEYMNFVLKIFPQDNKIDEIIINDCTLTIGDL